MGRDVAAVFSMFERGHFQRVRALAADLVRGGFRTVVFTDRRLRDEVESAGAEFVDLFAGRPLADADAVSVPLSCRNVTFAGVHAEALAAEAGRLEPALVVSDTFTVAGRVVARLLGVPHVNVCANHNMVPEVALAALEHDPRVAVGPACHAAVEKLQRLGIANASPFSYVDGLSPYLNVYCEPPEFLTEDERRVFEPVAFYGSLPALDEIEARLAGGAPAFGGQAGELRVYASFGAIIWRYWTDHALETLGTIAEALGAMNGVRGLIGLGGADVGAAAARALERPNVAVVGYADQWRALRDADVFVTHQGLNSTHEAVFNLVPMLSYPFFGDQPALSARCRELGLAVPLANGPRGPVTVESFRDALGRIDRERMRERLAEARAWELETIAARGSVVERIAGLVGREREHQPA